MDGVWICGYLPVSNSEVWGWDTHLRNESQEDTQCTNQ